MKYVAASIFLSINAVFVIIKKSLLWTVQLVEVAELIATRWVYSPLVSLVRDDINAAQAYEELNPDPYHYHDLKDYLVRKLNL